MALRKKYPELLRSNYRNMISIDIIRSIVRILFLHYALINQFFLLHCPASRERCGLRTKEFCDQPDLYGAVYSK
ncbi:hypothetical protein V1478_004333 [Vespula squamosa]|uniref:Uncharacterized protein n=1 Tax=Vespula squamosa TaxID=30214 RepID=A0ABD2BHP4_VESSQ